jgi:hypothetical protein
MTDPTVSDPGMDSKAFWASVVLGLLCVLAFIGCFALASAVVR